MEIGGFGALLGLIYSFSSRLLDLSFYNLHLPLVLGATSGLCALVSGTLFRAFRTRSGLLYLLLTFWFTAGVPFAYWRGGSAAAVKDWMRTLLAWGLVVGLTATHRHSKLLLNTFVAAAATAALVGMIGGDVGAEGRLSLEQGRFGNPNYFAMVLVISLPFVWRMYAGSGRSGIMCRAAAVVCGGVICAALLRSGSRAGLYSVAIMILLVILRVSLLRKVQIAAAAVIVLAGALALLPRHLQDRYFTFASREGMEVESAQEAAAIGAAAGSTEQRQHLLRQSFQVSLERPLFGVGLGNFSPYVFHINLDLGRKKEPYLGTHNSYTQISSEAGIPALLIFLGIVAISWHSLTRLIRATREDSRPEARDLFRTAQSMQVCVGALCFFLLFIHMAYDMLPHMVLAFALAVASSGESELETLNARRTQPAAAGAVVRAKARAYSARS